MYVCHSKDIYLLHEMYNLFNYMYGPLQCFKRHRRKKLWERKFLSIFLRHPREWKKLFFHPLLNYNLQPPQRSSFLYTSSTTVVVVLHTHISTHFSLSRAMIFFLHVTHFSLNFLLILSFFSFISLSLFISGVIFSWKTSYFKWQRSKKDESQKFPSLQRHPASEGNVTKMELLIYGV